MKKARTRRHPSLTKEWANSGGEVPSRNKNSLKNRVQKQKVRDVCGARFLRPIVPTTRSMMKKELDVGPLLGEQMGSAPTVSVTCPPGFAPGAAFVVQDPSSGQQMQVVVPDGITPGQTFQVQVPFSVPAPVPMAQPYVEQQYAPQPVPPQQAPIIINNNNNDNNINTMQMQAPTPQQMYTHEPSTGWQSGLFECCNDIPVCALRPAAAHSKQLAPALAHPRPEDCVACHCPPSCRIVMSPPLSVQVSASGAASPVPTGCSSRCTWKTRCFKDTWIAL